MQAGGMTTTTRTPVPPKRLAEHALTSLAAPVQDAVAAAVGGGRVMLLGGLTAADTSRADIRFVDGHREEIREQEQP